MKAGFDSKGSKEVVIILTGYLQSLHLLKNCITTFSKAWKSMKSNCSSLEYFSQWDVYQTLWRAQGGNWHTLHCSSQCWMLHRTWTTNRKFSEPWRLKAGLAECQENVCHWLLEGSGMVMQTFEGQSQVCWPSNIIIHWYICMFLKCLKFLLLCVLHLAINFQETGHCVFTNDKLPMSELRVLHVLTILYQITGSAVLNIKGHYLGGNFCFLLKGLVPELEAVLMLLLSPGSVKRSQESSLRQWVCFGFAFGLTVELFSACRKTLLLGTQGEPWV